VVEHAKKSDMVVVLENDAAELFDRTKDASQRLKKSVMKGIKQGKTVVATVPTLPKLAQGWQKVVRSVTRA
jgi:hypothetical protein